MSSNQTDKYIKNLHEILLNTKYINVCNSEPGNTLFFSCQGIQCEECVLFDDNSRSAASKVIKDNE